MTRREIARAFHIKGHDRIALKALLQELVQRGELLRKGKAYSTPLHDLYCEAVVIQLTHDGEVLAEQISPDPTIKPLRFLLSDAESTCPPLAIGERVLVRYRRTDDLDLAVSPILGIVVKKLTFNHRRIIGVFRTDGTAGRVFSADRRDKNHYVVSPLHTLTAQDGDVVEAELLPRRHPRHLEAKVVNILGAAENLRSPTFIAIHHHGLPTTFSPDALSQAEKATLPSLQGREDLRAIPFVTIDDEDARDFDDAVWAQPDPDPQNSGGWQLMVAIADVSHYVKPFDALDLEAFQRGNSVYFPDHVIPMLPEALSNGLCSLQPHEERACLAVEMFIDQRGKLLRHRFIRGFMRSVARLTYRHVQKAWNKQKTPYDQSFIEDIIHPLYGAFRSLKKNREYRGTLELELPEERIYLTPEGTVSHIAPRERYDSHKLIEEFMILANVAAAITLNDKQIPVLYRVHDEPNQEKIHALTEFLRGLGLSFTKGQVIRPKTFNTLLKKVAGTPHAHIIHELVLRTQAQAIYSPENSGHFGLSLARYCHFTSPIRRYADLIVHRALVYALRLEEEASYPYTFAHLQKMGEHLSLTERRAAAAERETIERYIAGYLSQHQGQTFACRISGVSDAGLFLYVLDNGADGLVPMRLLPLDMYHYDRQHHQLIGRRRHYTFQIGQSVTARLEEANPLTGGLIFSLILEKSMQEPASKHKQSTHQQNKKKKKSFAQPASPEPTSSPHQQETLAKRKRRHKSPRQ
jgi:ribonuclease R